MSEKAPPRRVLQEECYNRSMPQTVEYGCAGHLKRGSYPASGIDDTMEPDNDQQTAETPSGVSMDVSEDEHFPDEHEPQPLARVRYGLGKELRLYSDVFVVLHKEESDELRLNLSSIRRLILTPGEHTPSKLVLMFDLDDGNTIIAAEGMTNVRDFRTLLSELAQVRPEIELDPPNMDEQLMQAMDIRRRSLLGCYGSVLGACVLVWIVYMVVAYLGAHALH